MHRKQPRLLTGTVLFAVSCLLPALEADAQPAPIVVKIVAKKFDFAPARIVVHKGVPVNLELTSADRKHGFAAPDLGIRVDIKPNETTRVRFVPSKLGTFAFHCDVFCGDGHESMTGEFVVEP